MINTPEYYLLRAEEMRTIASCAISLQARLGYEQIAEMYEQLATGIILIEKSKKQLDRIIK